MEEGNPITQAAHLFHFLGTVGLYVTITAPIDHHFQKEVQVEDGAVVAVVHSEEEDQVEATLEGVMVTMEEIYRHQIVIGMEGR